MGFPQFLAVALRDEDPVLCLTSTPKPYRDREGCDYRGTIVPNKQRADQRSLNAAALLVPEQSRQENGRERALLVLISNNLCCSPPGKVGTKTLLKRGPFQVTLGARLIQHLLAFVCLPLTLYKNERCALDRDAAAISSKSKPLGTPDLPAK